MKITITDKEYRLLGYVDTESGPLVGKAHGIGARDSTKGGVPDSLQPSSISIGGITVDEALKLQGKNVVIFELTEV